MQDAPSPPETAGYQVLARKYRPGHFRDLIGQEAMVQTLTNAFAHDRIAHAFMLTGVRGVGKTTTARIIAKGLNCTGRVAEGHGDKPTIDPCGVCPACLSIADGRNVDVIEMDAASNTGVDDVREIIDSVRYRAAEARYKVYIIDEVHMLSKSAFNALLKTLEEPPEHVKFVFATTEIRKVPVTVLSRCQRFDLRRIEPDQMIAHLEKIAGLEGAQIERDALGLITRAAEGSVRDALSLLDHSISHGSGEVVTAATTRSMLGLADRGRVFDLFEAIMRGDAAGALAELGGQYADGADPAVVLRDLAELTHWISVLRISDAAAEDPTVSPSERERGRDLAKRLKMPALTRAWQMLLKALEEVPVAPSPMMAAEMAVIRLTHVADLPSPGDLVRRLQEAEATAQGAGAGTDRPHPAPAMAPSAGPSVPRETPREAPRENPSYRPQSAENAPQARLRVVAGGAAQQLDVDAAEPVPVPQPAELAEALDIIVAAGDLLLASQVERYVRPVRIRPGTIEFLPAPGAPADLAGRLAKALLDGSGRRWSVVVAADGEAGPTLQELREQKRAAVEAETRQHPLVLAAFEVFPGARIEDIRPLTAADDPIPDPTFDGVEMVDIEGSLLDGDDPFEEEL